MSFPPNLKKFSTDRVLTRCADHESIKNERIGHRLIRRTMRSQVSFGRPKRIRGASARDDWEGECRVMPATRERPNCVWPYRLQSPSFFFRRSFTACGLALPPEAFITWPTN